MFKFNFAIQDDVKNEASLSIKDNCITESSASSENLQCYESEQIDPTIEHFENLGLFKLNSTFLSAGKNKIYFIKSGNLKNFNKRENIKDINEAESTHSDLIPGIYEGGAKIWECTDDLVQYLLEHYPLDYFNNKLVLDLGCGSGLLGIYAMMSGAKVHFQDYNKDVLETITIPNVLINIIDPQLKKNNIQFFSGDWYKYTNLTKNDEKFDIILTSETIYNPLNQKKLLDTFDMKLQTDGIILLAAKVYYFGVGGGIRQFEELIQIDGRFVSKVLWTCTNEICREILEIQRRKKIS